MLHGMKYIDYGSFNPYLSIDSRIYYAKVIEDMKSKLQEQKVRFCYSYRYKISQHAGRNFFIKSLCGVLTGLVG